MLHKITIPVKKRHFSETLSILQQKLTAARIVMATVMLSLYLCPEPAEAISISTVGNDGITTAQLTAALQGSGVTISNLTITNSCANVNNAVGLFSQGTTPTGPGPVLGDISGIVLGTGALKGANALVSPNNVANWTSTLCAANVSDPDMVLLEPQTANGEYVAIEFDIVPSLPIMAIPFQFGSDEFPEYVCSAYNDVAGIFVSGPGISGPYSRGAQNYAKTPGGDLTSINWVNTGLVGSQGNAANCGSLTNTAYYTDNSNGNTTGGNATVATTNANLQLDGWTNYIYQTINVIPGQTYHVKAAVADAGDRIYDSSIFFHLIFSTGTLAGFDFGDAPDSYKTLTASGGPRHAINPNIYLGTTPPDSEVTGQPSVEADGDNNNGTNDEDGVAFFPPLFDNATSYSINVVANNTTGQSANLTGWIDFNRNGSFDTGEGSTATVPSGTVNGTVTMTWNGLSGLVTGKTYARFRLTTDTSITTSTPGGTANNGEVEDFTLEIYSTAPATGNKPLYLYDATSTPARKLSRTPMPVNATSYVTIAKGSTLVSWTMSPALQLPVTINSGNIPVKLWLATNSARTYTIPVTLKCGASYAGATSVATLATGTAALTATPTAFTFNLPRATAYTCAAGNAWYLDITNTMTGGTGARDVRVYPSPSAGNYSNVTLNSQNVININNSDITFYDAPYPGGTAITSVSAGQPVYIRASVTDPFGSYDISSATLTLSNPSGTVMSPTPVAMIAKTSDTPVSATKIFEYAYTVPVAGPVGNWSALVLAREGTENNVSDSAQAVMPVTVLPSLIIAKSAIVSTGNPKARPGDTISYTVTVTETQGGTPGVNSVVVSDFIKDIISNYIDMRIDTYGTSPFEPFSLSPGTSGLTLGLHEYSTDGGTSWVATNPPNPAGSYDPTITNWRLTLNGTMAPSSSFSLNYSVKVR